MEENARVHWSNDVIKCFLETSLDEVHRVGKLGTSLRKESWAILGKKLEERFDMKLTQKQLKNQYDYLRVKYTGWAVLKSRTGNIYNPETNMFTLTNAEWEDFFKGHDKCRTLKHTPLPFPDLCTSLFQKSVATGRRQYAPSSNRERSSSSRTSQIQSLDIEDTPTHTEEDDVQDTFSTEGFIPNQEVPRAAPSNTKGQNAIPSQSEFRPKKKGKMSTNNTDLQKEMATALKSIVGTLSGQASTCSVSACVEKLNTLGFEEMDPLYMAAFEIFGESITIREIWLNMPQNPEFLKMWLSKKAKQLNDDFFF